MDEPTYAEIVEALADSLPNPQLIKDTGTVKTWAFDVPQPKCSESVHVFCADGAPCKCGALVLDAEMIQR